MGWAPIPAARSGDMAVHAALLPGGARGKVLYFGGYLVEDTHVYDVATQTVSDIAAAASPSYNAFCSGHAFLADGRLLVAGGQLRVFDQMGQEVDPPPGEAEPHPHGGMGWGGERSCSIFSPLGNAWGGAAPLNLDPAGAPESGGRWYPTLCSLADGRVLAVGGHPDRREAWPAPFPGNRHNNHVPERYSPGADAWTLLGDNPPATDETTAEVFSDDYDYQRTHLLPDGRVFFSSPVRGVNRFYEPGAGRFATSPVVALPADDLYQSVSARWSAVMLPLLHGESHRPRVLLIGAATARIIDLGAGPSPLELAWKAAKARVDWIGPPPARNFAVPVLLPDGRVFVSGGTAQDGNDATRQANAVRRAEIYTPGIDWGAGEYDDAFEDWETQSEAEAATVQRHYHSTALLLPDGSVWTAGSNGPSDEGGGNELRFEIYEPDYFDVQRPQLTACPPSTGYAILFPIGVDDASAIRRVVLTRCGSVTHGFNPDQRYITCDFQVNGPNALVVIPPVDGAIAPPGRYLVWVLDADGRPCEQASFLRLSRQKAYITADISTFSIHEVDALGLPAKFPNACRLVLDGFLPSEVTETPTPSIVQDVDGLSVSLGAPSYEAGAGALDTAQRIVYPITVDFTSMEPFDTFPADEPFGTVTLRAEMGHFAAETPLTLSRNPNPRMSDGDPPYLSIDLRVFETKPGAPPFTAGVEHPAGQNGPLEYVNAVIDEYRDRADDPDHPFDQLPTDPEANRLALYSHDDEGDPVYNYALARVRYRAPEGIDAAQVRLFFRLWTTGWTALEYTDPHADSGSYRRHGDGPAATPLLGITGGEINNVPCFAEARTANMAEQTDEKNLWTFEGAGAEEVHGYFGCWLDMNQDVARFPDDPVGPGPYGGTLKSIQEHMHGLHQCLVAEIHWLDDPIPIAATPGSSDNLAQRNILLDESDNPGGLAAHVVHHTFELKPSPFPFGKPGAVGAAAAGSARMHPDELAIEWGNLPRDSQVTLFMPQVDAGAVVEYAARRLGPGNLVRVGANEIGVRVTDVGFVPLPGPLAQNIAALMTVQLPPNLDVGQRFGVVLRQIDGRRMRVVGATRFEISVAHASDLLPRFERNLSVLRHIAKGIAVANRWHPIFERYVGQLADRVRAFGGDPDAIEPSPTGGARRPRPGGRPGGHGDGHGDGDAPVDGIPGGRADTGKVAELLYDCYGDFEGFVLDTCPGRRGYRARRRAIEEVVRRACCEESRVSVWVRPDDPHRPVRIVVHC